MDPNLVLLLACAAGITLVWVVVKLLKNVLIAILIGAVAAGVLWWTLPRVSERDDLVGETARRASELGERAGEAAEEVSEGAKRAAQAAQDLAEGARDLRDRITPTEGNDEE